MKALLAFGFGLYAGLLLLFVNDYRKRYQGLLLVLGTAIVVGGLALGGIGVVNIPATPLNVVALALGLVLGVSSEGIRIARLGIEGELRSVNLGKSSLGNAVRDDDEDAHFTIASMSLVGLIVALVVGGNVLYLVVSDLGVDALSYAVGYAITTLVFFYFLWGFINLTPGGDSDSPLARLVERLGLGSGTDDGSSVESSTSFEVLGPQQSGKTYFALALYLQVLNNPEQYDLNSRSKGMRQLVKEYNDVTGSNGAAREDARLGWTIGNTLPDEPTPLRFEFEARDRFTPKNVEVNMLDHAGEILDDVSARLSGETAATDGGQSEETDDDDDGNDSSPVSTPDAMDTIGPIDPDEDDTETGRDFLGSPSQSETAGRDTNGSDIEPDGADAETGRDLVGSRGRSETDDAGTGGSDIDRVGTDDATAGDGDTEDGTTSGDGADIGATSGTGSEPTGEEDGDPAGTDSSATDGTDGPDATASTEGIGDESGSTRGQFTAPEQPSDEPDGDSSDGGASAGSLKSPKERAIEDVTRNVQQSDKLVFVLDSERFHGQAPDAESEANMQVEDFSSIVENVDLDDAVLIASKADFFIDGWQEEKGHKLRPTSNEQRFESFREYVESQMRTDLQIESLAQTVNAPTIHPVYFVTEVRDGEMFPKPDENGNIQPVGFDQALEALIRDA